MAPEIDREVERRFNAVAVDLKTLIEKRRNSWRAFSIMEWEDVASVLLTRIYRQFHLYDSTRPLDRWANTVISNAISSLLRDKLYKTARPCVAANSYGAPCSFNLGGDKCKWTETNGSCSGVQDASCWAYAKWLKKKKDKFAISTPLSMEHHMHEASSMPDELLSEERVEAARQVIDTNIQRRLTKEEYRIYILLYVKHLSIKEAAQKMGFKETDETKAYFRVRTASLKIEEIAGQLISENSVFR